MSSRADLFPSMTHADDFWAPVVVSQQTIATDSCKYHILSTDGSLGFEYRWGEISFNNGYKLFFSVVISPTTCCACVCRLFVVFFPVCACMRMCLGSWKTEMYNLDYRSHDPLSDWTKPVRKDKTIKQGAERRQNAVELRGTTVVTLLPASLFCPHYV